MFCKKGVLKNVAKFTRKQQATDLQLYHQKIDSDMVFWFFPENFASFLGTPFFKTTPLVAAFLGLQG